jgi:hypothetical protein
MASSYEISRMGSSLELNPRRRYGVPFLKFQLKSFENSSLPKVIASISSEAVAYTFPAFANVAHWASAYKNAFKKTIIILFIMAPSHGP